MLDLNKIFLKKRLASINLVVLDVDGVLTDGNIYLDSNGIETKRFNVKDGLGIKLMQENNIEIALISGGTSESSLSRAKRLNIKYCFFEVTNKLRKLKDLKKSLKLKESEILYMGDDLNDLPVKDFVGLFIAPRDANNFVKKKADIVKR